MPQKKKPARSNKTNKSKAKKKVAAATVTSNGDHPASAPGLHELNLTNTGVPKTPTPFSQAILDEINWNEFVSDYQQKRLNQPEPSAYRSIYLRYKQATLRFKDRLRSMVPDEIFQGDYVQCLIDAVDFLKDNNFTNIPNSLMMDLKVAIRVRKRVADTKFRGSRGDEGHSFFLAVLTYCFTVLRRLKPRDQHRSSRRRATSFADQKESEPNENRFAALFLDEEDDENDDEEDLPLPSSAEPLSKPVEPQGLSSSSLSSKPSRPTLNELLRGSDREAAILFLMTLDETMGFSAMQYVELKRHWRLNQEDGDPPLAMIEQIIEASTVSNFGIQYVQSLDETLAADFPHMNTIYRLLAVVLFSEFTEELTTEITTVNPSFKHTDAKMFLGDCIEKAMRYQTDPTLMDLAAEFCRTWKISTKRVEDYYMKCIFNAVLFELPIGKDTRQHNQWVVDEVRKHGVSIRECSWLPGLHHIGSSERSILMTIKLLQALSVVIHAQKGRLICKNGYFGKSWDETRAGMAKRIVQDMDQLLMGEIMPVLINICYGGLGRKLPYEKELLPLFPLLRSYVNDPKKPVSWALAFGIHTLLNSIFEVQGNGDVHGIARIAEISFDVYFDQISEISDEMKDEPQTLHWAANIKKACALKMLVAPPTLQPSREQMLRACWNPFCAGALLSYITYFSNLQEGMSMIDDFGQLRMVLHLYNALKDLGLIPVRPDGILEKLDETFQTSKAIWEGPKPTKGNFVLRFWIAFGTDPEEAKRMSRNAENRFSGGHGTVFTSPLHQGRPQRITRRITPIEPDKLSKSFRRIMNRDFSDVVDDYHPVAQRRSSPMYDHAVRCNDTIDAIDKEQPFLAMNMTAMGSHLNLFIIYIFGQYSDEIQSMVETYRAGQQQQQQPRMTRTQYGRQSWENSDAYLERQAMAHFLAEEILGRLDFVDSSAPIASDLVARMDSYFNHLPPEDVMYFIPER